jgi:hypothetical protein
MDLVIGIFAGAILSLIITHYYYRKSSKQPPEWAKPFIERLPNEPPTKEKLIELFQEALDKGEAKIDPIFGYVACPKCKASAKDFKKSGSGDDYTTIVSVYCPHCGWSNTIG